MFRRISRGSLPKVPRAVGGDGYDLDMLSFLDLDGDCTAGDCM